MRKKTFSLSKEAEIDLTEIWMYSNETWSSQQADRYINLIFDEIDNICRYSNSGKSKATIREGYRAAKVKSHIIFYRIVDEIIEVIRILHERMDIENRLGN
jgi:toxin ParE1/3/4